MALRKLDLVNVPIIDFCARIGMDEVMLRGLSSVATLQLNGVRSPAWLLEYSLDSFAGLSAVGPVIELPATIKRSVPARQASFLFGRAAAAAATCLHAKLGSFRTIPIGTQGAPIWPTGITGSITHTNTHAVAWAERCDATYCGIDLEQILTPRDALALWGQIMAYDEAEQLRHALGPAGFHLGVTLLFSAKEASYKALFPLVKRAMDFHELALVAIDIDQAQLRLQVRDAAIIDHNVPAMIEVGFGSLSGSILTHTAVPRPSGHPAHPGARPEARRVSR